jgi:hypothetical protein
MIRQQNISSLANRLARAGQRRIPENVLERDYCLAWFLAMLAQSDLHDTLAFKGGTALRRCYFADYRFSEDLDFTLLRPTPLDDILRSVDRLFAALEAASAIRFTFDRQDRHGHVNSHTFYLNYTGPLPAPSSVKVDITIEERLCFPLEQRPVLRSYEEFADLPENRTIHVYSLEEIAVEKTVALADPARTEPRDLYDLWYLTTEAPIDLSSLLPGIREKLEFRQKPFAGIQTAINAKQARFKTRWENQLTQQMTDLPEFDEVFRAVRRSLRQARLP